MSKIKMRVAYFRYGHGELLEDDASGEYLSNYTKFDTRISFPDDETEIDVWEEMLLVDGVLYNVGGGRGENIWPCPDVVSLVTIHDLNMDEVDDIFHRDYKMMDSQLEVLGNWELKLTRDLARSSNPQISNLRIYRDKVYRMPDNYHPTDYICKDVVMSDICDTPTDYPIYTNRSGYYVLILMKSGKLVLGNIESHGDVYFITPELTLNTDCSEFQGVWMNPFGRQLLAILNNGVLTEYYTDNVDNMGSRVLVERGYIIGSSFYHAQRSHRVKPPMID